VTDYLAANRANWDDRVPIHRRSKFYDVESWLDKQPGLRKWEQVVLGDVTDLDVVHLQCHFGLDTLSLANAGANVTGLDFSPAAIAEARSLAIRARLDDRARFVEGDVLAASKVLSPNKFDLVYTSIGALCWLPSVRQWASEAAALLRPGGRLYLHDGHPLAWALAEDDLRIESSYFEEAAPLVEDYDVTYTDGTGRIANSRSYEWNHSIGEIVTSVLGQGLRLLTLTEHDWTLWERFPWLVKTTDDRWKVPSDRPRIPLTFTLLADRPL